VDITAMEQMYTDACTSIDEVPGHILTPEGCFVRDEHGNVTVFHFDSEGNMYELPLDEQDRRKDLLRKRLGDV
jgi:hypothetical protein